MKTGPLIEYEEIKNINSIDDGKQRYKACEVLLNEKLDEALADFREKWIKRNLKALSERDFRDPFSFYPVDIY